MVNSLWCWVSNSSLRGALLHVGQLVEPPWDWRAYADSLKSLQTLYVLLKNPSWASLCPTKHSKAEMMLVAKIKLNKTLDILIFYLHIQASVISNPYLALLSVSLLSVCFRELENMNMSPFYRDGWRQFVHMDVTISDKVPLFSFHVTFSRSCVRIRPCPTHWASWQF